jgi:hypothetical protein
VDSKLIKKLLEQPFPAKDVKFRPAPGGKGKLAYVTSRAIFDRLDDTVGPMGWQTNFQPGPAGGVIAGIGVYLQDNGWVWKWDGADNTKIEPVKGGLSSAIKRAAAQWGIGRYLYNLDKSGKLPQWALPSNPERPSEAPGGDRAQDGQTDGASEGGSLSEAKRALLEAFVDWGAFQVNIEQLLGKKLNNAGPSDVDFMRKEYLRLKKLSPAERKQQILEW